MVAVDGEEDTDSFHDGACPPGTLGVELLRGGLTFDLCGLAPGPATRYPEVDFRYDLPAVPACGDYEALQLLPGQHLAGGERSMPVAKALLATARDLAHHLEGVEAVIWPPSSSAIGQRFFESTITAWVDGGPFPALGLVSFAQAADEALQSVGLDFWIDQEVRIETPLSVEKVSAIRLGVRLINQMIMVGGLERDERIIAPDGTRLVLRVSRNGQFIRVMRE